MPNNISKFFGFGKNRKSNSDEPSGPLKRVLVVDDDQAYSRTVKLSLEMTKRYEVKVVNDPTLAVPTASIFEPNIIILDIMMPKLPGDEVYRRLQEEKKTQKTPVLFLSGLATKKTSIGPRDEVFGRNVTLCKPVVIKELIETVDKIIAAASNSR